MGEEVHCDPRLGGKKKRVQATPEKWMLKGYVMQKFTE